MPSSGPILSVANRRFLERTAKSLVAPDALSATHIDVVANIERMLTHASAEHRRQTVRLVSWSRRISWVYGGHNMPLRARHSRSVLLQKLAHGLSVLCLVGFWGDEAALTLVDSPGARR